jgi:NitT/TauT family transport system substrate-binding protein
MRRRQLLPCLAAALAGCGKEDRQPRRLRVGLIPRFTLAPLYLADELGFFREAGLQVELLPFQDAPAMLTLLVGGGIQAAFVIPTAGFLNAVLRGARLRIVASRDIAVPSCTTGGAVFGHVKSFPNGLRDLRALKGKRVAVHGLMSLPAFFLDQLLASAGMTTTDIRLVFMSYPEAAAAVTAGKIDAVAAAHMDKDLDYASAQVVRSVTLAEILPNYQFSFILFGPALVEADPEIGGSFLWAYLRGVHAYRAGRTPRALEELARATRAQPAAARAACRDGISADGRVDPASVQRFVDWAVRKGYIPKAVQASQLIDTRFLDQAHRRLGRPASANRTVPWRIPRARS